MADYGAVGGFVVSYLRSGKRPALDQNGRAKLANGLRLETLEWEL